MRVSFTTRNYQAIFPKAGLLPAVLLKALCIVCSVSFAIDSAHAIDLKSYSKLQAVADELISEKHYTQAELERVFAPAQIQQSVLKAMKSPAEYKFTWGKYRKLFLKEDRIQQGVDFWREYEDDLSRAEQNFGVPASVIVAIIGVESKFGRYKGAHKVLDSLVSLVVDFPRRSAFFAKELKQFLILTKENKLDSAQVLGSYAGAVGFPQFIASSYRAYAIDFSGDGVADLINEPVDAIGSVANYFVENGWLQGQPVTSAPQLNVSGEIADLANRKRKIQFSAQSLINKGAALSAAIPAEEKLNVLMLDVSEVVNEPAKSGSYIVRAGDTACEIAERLKVTCKSLISLNKLNKRGEIFRDQRLKIPQLTKPATNAENKPQTTSSNKFIAKVKDASGKWVVADTAQQAPIASKPTVEPPSNGVQARYFYTHENFYVITRYNHSVLYAMAVHDLSQAIDAAMLEQR